MAHGGIGILESDLRDTREDLILILGILESWTGQIQIHFSFWILIVSLQGRVRPLSMMLI